MIDVIQNTPTENNQLRLTAIKCTPNDCIHNNHGVCACMLPNIYMHVSAYEMMHGYSDNPVLGCKSYAPIKIEVKFQEKPNDSLESVAQHIYTKNHTCAICGQEIDPLSGIFVRQDRTNVHIGCHVGEKKKQEKQPKKLMEDCSACFYLTIKGRCMDCIVNKPITGHFNHWKPKKEAVCSNFEMWCESCGNGKGRYCELKRLTVDGVTPVCWKPKEEPKMSNVKITYKPVDKKVKAEEYLASLYGALLPVDYPAVLSSAIDSIYNAKEEDGEISEVKIELGPVTVEIYDPKYSPGTVRISIEDATTETGHVDYISKQEAFELGQALIKMSEQL